MSANDFLLYSNICVPLRHHHRSFVLQELGTPLSCRRQTHKRTAQRVGDLGTLSSRPEASVKFLLLGLRELRKDCKCQGRRMSIQWASVQVNSESVAASSALARVSVVFLMGYLFPTELCLGFFFFNVTDRLLL